jgi:thiol-disulfide isomerase/thioredoxin
MRRERAVAEEVGDHRRQETRLAEDRRVARRALRRHARERLDHRRHHRQRPVVVHQRAERRVQDRLPLRRARGRFRVQEEDRVVSGPSGGRRDQRTGPRRCHDRAHVGLSICLAKRLARARELFHPGPIPIPTTVSQSRTMRFVQGILALLVAAAPALAGSFRPGDHGRLDWFGGTFAEALEKAKSEKKIVFVDFWASWCGWCKRFDGEALEDSVVVAETRDLVCLTIDAESKDGQPLAARYGVAGLPALVFVEPDGSLRERLSGYRTAPQFVQELRRIRANEGDPRRDREAAGREARRSRRAARARHPPAPHARPEMGGRAPVRPRPDRARRRVRSEEPRRPVRDRRASCACAPTRMATRSRSPRSASSTPKVGPSRCAASR